MESVGCGALGGWAGGLGTTVPGDLHQTGEPLFAHLLLGVLVAGYVLGLGWPLISPFCLHKLQKINGPRLLLLREEKDLHTLGVEQGFPSAGFLEAIQELRQQEFYRPRNFQEYKAVHQKRVLTTAVCYKMWPRITLLYAYLFDYHDVFVPVMKPYFSALVEDRVQGGGQHLESQLQQGDTEAETEPMQFGGDTEEVTKEKVYVEHYSLLMDG